LIWGGERHGLAPGGKKGTAPPWAKRDSGGVDAQEEGRAREKDRVVGRNVARTKRGPARVSTEREVYPRGGQNELDRGKGEAARVEKNRALL